jgi:anaerobic ribonucleoside-triphosphate reductase activating protein
LNYGQIRNYDIANGPGIRCTLFVTGCYRNCYNCFNKEYQDPEYGELYTRDVEDTLISYLKDDSVSGITILGGEPFIFPKILYALTKRCKEEAPDKTVWVYTGNLYEDLMLAFPHDFFEFIDVIVDGEYIDKLRDPSMAYRGSSNQRFIDVQATLQDNCRIHELYY